MSDAARAVVPIDEESELPGAVDPAEIRLAAMNLLARREHSLRELGHKLRSRFSDGELLEQELQRLADENLQSDLRFACSYARQRAERGFGPLRLRQEMRDKGLSDAIIAEVFEAEQLDWRALAARAYGKKFGSGAAPGLKEKARRARFMQYRGFNAEHYEDLLGG